MKKLIYAAIAVFTAGCQGTRPQNIGIVEGHLTPCPESPNCVSTKNSNALHKIEPLPLKGGSQASLDAIRAIVKEWPRAEIVVDKSDYLHVEFSSRLMRFVDDVEFFAPATASVIEIRSASRLGYKDFDVNRDRVEEIRQKYLGQGGSH